MLFVRGGHGVSVAVCRKDFIKIFAAVLLDLGPMDSLFRSLRGWLPELGQKRPANRCQKVSIVEWLEEECACPTGHRFAPVGGIIFASHDDDPRVWRTHAQLGQNLESGNSRHANVDHDQSHPMTTCVVEKARWIVKFLRVQTIGRKETC